ncbi:sulfatase [Reichenbachiella sp. MSK19-1]|uniref:sulfatase family protein n=1 Tax=Reichenbachiella sp. MSK19-1 TaxID=1897631 RepID=UPI0013141172|nr:sulfatase-like hydrolase/transferase [Reichenbachiella sp. MSK19-1]
MRKTLLVWIGALSMVGFFACQQNVKRETASRPNIVMILCDDLGYGDVGFNGATDIRTPVLDQLAAGGVRFSSAYVPHPFCGPSRAGMMTGRYPHTIGAQFNLPPNTARLDEGITRDEVFISKVLQVSGYHTGIVGKWHLGAAAPYHPNQRGFDEFYGFLGGGHKYFPEEYLSKYDEQHGSGDGAVWDYLRPLEYNGHEVRDTAYLTDALSHQAVDFISRAAQLDNPFFLYLAYNAPHVPLEAKAEDLALFAEIENPDRRTYAAMVYAVDRGVDEVVNALKAAGEYDNTLIVFLSDNGGNTDHGANNGALREGKGSTYEGGYRVPMFWHWPNQIQAHEACEYTVSALDFYPTFAALAEAEIPSGKLLDGQNVWPAVVGQEDFRAEAPLYVMRHRDGYSDVGVRQGQWKAVKAHQQSWQLFDVNQDIGERKDLRQQYPAQLSAMVDSAEKWSETHVQPLWFHNQETADRWHADGMPRLEETFQSSIGQ